MLKKYLLNTSGNFGIMFAMCATALVMGVGVAVDYAGMTSQRQKLQNYIDAAVLAAVTSDTKNIGQIRKIVNERIAILNIDGWDIKAKVRFDGTDVVIDAQSQYDAVLMGPALKLLGNDTKGKLKVGASTAAPTITKEALNIVLVLDTTDSMSGSNIDGLKDAADDLLDDLRAFGENVNVSIVPFGQYVNITSQRGQNWLDLSEEGVGESFVNEEVQVQNVITPSVCTPNGNIIPGQPIYRDGVEVGMNPDIEEKTCTTAELGEPTTSYRSYQRNYKWNGCAGSRSDGDNIKADYAGIEIPGAMEVHLTGDLTTTERSARCGVEMMPLSNDFTKMKNLIGSLTTSGDTYLPSGLLWGWRALTPAAPFTEAAAMPPETKSVMIFMTDGFNTLSQDGVYHDGWVREAGLDVAKGICENIKNDKVDVYTVAYNMPSIDDANETRNLLKQCATHPSKSYEARDADQLKETFRKILNSLGTIRLKYRET